jgi:hypothetical protein
VEHVLETGGCLGTGKDLLLEEQVLFGVVEHFLEAGGHLGAGEEHVREAPPARINFSFFFLMFLTYPEIQAD